MRAFKPGAELGKQPLLGAVSVAIIDPDESTAALDFVEFRMAANSESGRQAFAKSWTLEFVKGIAAQSKGKPVLHVKRVQVGAPVTVGETAFRIPLTLTTDMGTIRVSLEAVQVDRVVAMLELMSWFNRPLESSDRAAAHNAIEEHLHGAFTVANTAAPTITGSAVQGQTLTADEGAWAGAPSRFSYSWSRCDSAGNNCQAIAGATAKTYQVTTADGGATLTATVTAANSVTSLEATSTPATISS